MEEKIETRAGPVRRMHCPQCGQETVQAHPYIYGEGVPQIARCPWCGETHNPIITLFAGGQIIWRGCSPCERKLVTAVGEAG